MLPRPPLEATPGTHPGSATCSEVQAQLRCPSGRSPTPGTTVLTRLACKVCEGSEPIHTNGSVLSSSNQFIKRRGLALKRGHLKRADAPPPAWCVHCVWRQEPRRASEEGQARARRRPSLFHVRVALAEEEPWCSQNNV